MGSLDIKGNSCLSQMGESGVCIMGRELNRKPRVRISTQNGFSTYFKVLVRFVADKCAAHDNRLYSKLSPKELHSICNNSCLCL